MTTYPGEPDAIIDLNATGNPPGPGAFVVRDDVTGETLMSIETGGASAGPHITLLSDDGANISSVTVGQNSTGLQGRILAEARTTGTPLPGLVGFQADDGTPIFLTAWALGGGQYELKVSIGAPANSGDGVPIATAS